MRIAIFNLVLVASLLAVAYTQTLTVTAVGALAAVTAAAGLTAATVGGLGLKGGLIARGSRNRNRGSSGGSYHRRRHRSVDQMDFDDIKRLDVLGCALKVVCELETRPIDSLQEDELLIVQLFGDATTNKVKNSKTAKADYELAAFIGATSKDPRICRQVAPLCNDSVQDIMDYLRTHN